ncbi:hypothetical protein NC653_015269 [Populus alba x Populus x berolinensis]|uniref:Uncharacterized protein n=1 Tax=Populus alba x Populus x berolinensis TaxID=444605 RepID=A0AAD6QK68_9ROSI|nr:hypothetical protein NC653_015269 [Populus alba x Populus x berolinensis]
MDDGSYLIYLKFWHPSLKILYSWEKLALCEIKTHGVKGVASLHVLPSEYGYAEVKRPVDKSTSRT